MVSHINRSDIKQGRIHGYRAQLRAGGQGLYLRSLDHLGKSSEVKDRKEGKDDRQTDRQIDGWTDGPTKRV